MIDPLMTNWGSFLYQWSDLSGDNEVEWPTEKGGMCEEDQVFWEQVTSRNSRRRGGRTQKRSCGKAKLERVGRGNGRWK